MTTTSARARFGQRLFFALLYFSEGAPIGYIWWAMPTRLRAAGMPVDEVATLTALLTVPWACKFLWAPAVDRLRGPRWSYRAWITVAQVAMGLTLVPLACLPVEDVVDVALWLLLAHACAAATQDVAIDGLAIATVDASDRARTTAWMQAGMLVGRAGFGGLALAAERWVGADTVVFILIACIWTTLVAVWLTRPSARAQPDPSRRAPLVEILNVVLRRPSTWIGLGIALTAGAGFEAVAGLMGSYLLDRSATQSDVGWFFALPVVGCMIVGGLMGGRLAGRLGHCRVARWSVVAIFISVSLIVAADTVLGWRGRELMVAAVPLYLGVGLLTASSYALFMDLTDPAIGATQFSVFMSMTNLCEVWSVALAGWLAARAGYGWGFLSVAVASLVSLALLTVCNRMCEHRC